jgi:hypothetical protein
MAAGDLTTSDKVIAYLQTRPNITIDPALIATLVTAASQFIATYCSDPFVSQTYSELRDGDESGGSVGYGGGWPSPGWSSLSIVSRRPLRYVFAYSPVTAVASVFVNGTAIAASGAAPYQQGYIFDKTKLTILGIYVPPIPACVQITYTAGYATIPADIDQICVDLVVLKYLQRRRMGIASEAVNNVGSRTYTKNDLADIDKTVLDQRRRVAPVGNVISP